MKILQVMPEFGLAGAEIMAENLSYELRNNGIEAIVISFYRFESAITDRLLNKGIRIIYLDKKPGFDYTIFVKLREIIKQEKPDAIHTHRYVLPYVYIASFGYSCRIIHTIHNMAEKEVPNRQQSIQKVIFKSKKIIPVAISPQVKKSIMKRYDLAGDQVPMIYNGIDLSKYKKKESYHLDKGGLLLHIGRFSFQKNHTMIVDAFIDALKKYPECRLVFVGDGELKLEIEKKVNDNSIQDRVIFMGLIDNIPDILQQADIFLLPSNYEGMPITLIEAMASGMPIIATNVGGVPDMISDENGILINNNEQELTISIQKCLESQSLREKLGAQAYKDSSRFSVSNMMSAYVKLYVR